MKIQFGSIVVAGSGKIGGHVASRNRGGAYLRTKVTPVNPNTAAQGAVRSRLAEFSQAWRSLTQTQRDAWNAAVSDFAKTDIFGSVRNPSGINLFQRLNNNLAQLEIAQISVPPAVGDVPSEVLGAIVLNNTGSVGTVALADDVPAGVYMTIDATPSLSPGISFVKSEFRRIAAAEPEATTPINIWADYVAKFGAPVTGQKVFIRIGFINEATGQAGPYQIGSTIVLNA